jgi:hypothetical protein
MARLLDRLLARGFEALPHVYERHVPRATMTRALGETEARFVIDNVAEYFHFHAGKAPGAWTLSDFPDLAPPYGLYWMELTDPRPGARLPGARPRQLGLLTHAVTRERVEELGAGDPRPPAAGTAGALEAGARWFVASWLFLDLDSAGRPVLVAEYRYPLSPAGELLDLPGGAGGSETFVDSGSDEEARGAGVRLMQECLFPALLATSLLHCRNVAETPAPAPPPRLARAYRRRHKRDPVTFHTLAVGPVRPVRRRGGRAATEGPGAPERALHTVRGHFASYGPRYGRGRLFGRLEGAFWMRPHWRGGAAKGLALKDYDVRPAGREETRLP